MPQKNLQIDISKPPSKIGINIFNSINKFSKESKLAFGILVFSYLIVWFFSIGEYKTNIYNFSFCFSLAGIVMCLNSFFYSFSQITSDIKSNNWFTVGMDTLFNLFQIVFLIAGVRELTQRTDPFNTVLFFLFASLVFFGQIYINKALVLYKTTIICVIALGFMASLFKVLEINTPSDYLYLIWATGSYATLGVSLVLFFSTIRTQLNNLTK